MKRHHIDIEKEHKANGIMGDILVSGRPKLTYRDELNQYLAERASMRRRRVRIFWAFAGVWLLIVSAVGYVCVHFLLKWW